MYKKYLTKNLILGVTGGAFCSNDRSLRCSGGLRRSWKIKSSGQPCKDIDTGIFYMENEVHSSLFQTSDIFYSDKRKNLIFV
jgi:hypothetical protein